jgi:hypothetical protein
MKTALCVLAVTMAAVCSVQAQTSVTVPNYSFEDNTGAWGTAANWTGGYTQIAEIWGSFANQDADARQALWFGAGSITQTLPTPAAAAMTYSLQVLVGAYASGTTYPDGSPEPGIGTITLSAGSYVIATFTGTQPLSDWTNNLMTNFTATGSTPMSAAAAFGQPLTITLTGDGGNTHVSFDDVLLSYVPEYIPGDINGDGLVDVADYNIWAANVGATGANWFQGDLNGDGLVDVADYNIWAANVGKTSATPEPISMIILAIGGGLVALKRRNG